MPPPYRACVVNNNLPKAGAEETLFLPVFGGNSVLVQQVR